MTHPIEKWYKGKALEVIRAYVLPTLKEAETLGCWPKGASRKVRAALHKQDRAKKFALANDRREQVPNCEGLLVDITEDRSRPYQSDIRGWDVVVAMMYGFFERAPDLVDLIKRLHPLCVCDAEREALATAEQWAAEFAPIASLVKLLDETRPTPNFVFKTLSPTVFKNLSISLGVDFTSIRMPEIQWTWQHIEIDGKVFRIRRGVIVWPEGCQHGRSRFSGVSRSGNDQCHACGHAIKDTRNWVPIVADSSEGPLSLWVGRDCASKLFGVEVSGEATYDQSR